MDLLSCVRAANATEAWEMWYCMLAKQIGNEHASRDGAVSAEFINAVTVIDNPREGMVLSPTRNLSTSYAIGELLFYLSGSNELSAIYPYSKAWEKLSDDGETVNSAYGFRIHYKYGFDQWEYVKKLLRADPLSRQAVIHIKDADDKQTKDLPCTICLQFLIRDGKLHCTTFMRSNDIWLGFPYDVFCFTSLQVKLAMELGVPVGTYTHIAGSLHLYERNVQNSQD